MIITEKRVWRCLVWLPLFLILLGGAWSPLPAVPGEKGQGAWWAHVYGALTEKENPLVGRVQRVFKRVLASADKRANRFPRLMVLRGAGDPWALSLADGSVILTQKAMEFCYRDVPLAKGDARVAFVLGHELAHLSKDDFWHLAAFDSVRRFGNDPERSRETLDLLKRTEDLGTSPHARDIAEKKEMQADAYGLLYASMAGYDPKVVVDEKGRNFIKAWGDQIAGLVRENGGGHPAPAVRGDFLLANMRAVKNDLDLFYLGIRLYQIGRYRDALDFLSAFHEKFPSREVFNNLGLVHYQIAMEQLALEDPARTVRFNLGTLVDMKTRAEQYRGAGEGSRFGKALRHFRAACEMDPAYVPARVNHASALIMANRHSEALAVLDQAAGEKGASPPELFNNRAVALYLLGPSIGVDMYRQATTLLKETILKHPDYAPARFNLARLQAERGRNANAEKTFRAYLSLRPEGRFSDAAASELGMEIKSPYKQAAGKGSAHRPAFIPAPLLEPGNLGAADRKRMDHLTHHPLDPVTAYGDYYTGNSTLVLVLEDVVELVEQKVELKAEGNLGRLGRPNRILEGALGTTSLVYDNFAVDVRGGKITGVVYFSGG